jgi:hypothetical protein
MGSGRGIPPITTWKRDLHNLAYYLPIGTCGIFLFLGGGIFIAISCIPNTLGNFWAHFIELE